MNYSQIRKMDISNGEGVGVALFVQGCPIHCKGCFNESTWDFNGGNTFTTDTIDKIIDLCDKDYISRLSILGGEPFAENNLNAGNVFCLVKAFREKFGNSKKIWVYSGFTYEELCNLGLMQT